MIIKFIINILTLNSIRKIYLTQVVNQCFICKNTLDDFINLPKDASDEEENLGCE